MRYQLNDKERSKQQPLRLSICITFIVYVRTGIAVSNQNRISRKDRKNISEQLIDGFCILNENLYEERQGQILRPCIYIIVTQYETWLTLFCRPWRIICWILHLCLRCFRGLSQTFAKGIITDKEIRLNIPLQWFRMHSLLYTSVFCDNG